MVSKAEKEIMRQMSHKMSEKVCNEAYRSSMEKLVNQNAKKPRK